MSAGDAAQVGRHRVEDHQVEAVLGELGRQLGAVGRDFDVIARQFQCGREQFGDFGAVNDHEDMLTLPTHRRPPLTHVSVHGKTIRDMERPFV